MEDRQGEVTLSSEQIQRMEENRRKAQERLLNKRATQGLRTLPLMSSVLPGATPVCGPPPAKRPALQPPYHSRDDVHLSTVGPNPINYNTSATAHSSSQFEHVQHNSLTHKRVFDSASRTFKEAPPATSGLSTPSLSSLSTGTRRDASPALGGVASSSRGASSSMQMVISLTKKASYLLLFVINLIGAYTRKEEGEEEQYGKGKGGGEGVSLSSFYTDEA